MTPTWSRKKNVTRTKEGLVVHHIFEDHAIMLSDEDYAKCNPYEWQLAENLVYCDYLEHLYLHILICEYPAKNKNEFESVGIGGVINFIVPMLNDFYSGWAPKLNWLQICLDKISKNIDVYMILLKRFKINCKNYSGYTKKGLLKCENSKYGTWDIKKNKTIFEKIESL